MQAKVWAAEGHRFQVFAQNPPTFESTSRECYNWTPLPNHKQTIVILISNHCNPKEQLRDL